jgi:hypothetical protein
MILRRRFIYSSSIREIEGKTDLHPIEAKWTVDDERSRLRAIGVLTSLKGRIHPVKTAGG